MARKKSHKTKKLEKKQYMREKRNCMSEQDLELERQKDTRRKRVKRASQVCPKEANRSLSNDPSLNIQGVNLPTPQTPLPESTDSDIKAYTSGIFEAPLYICHSCRKMCYRQQITKTRSPEKYFTYLTDLYSDNEYLNFKNKDGLWLCNSCYSSVKHGRSPCLSWTNNLNPGDIPDELKVLNPMELRLITQSQAFMKMVVLPYGQKSLHGQVIHFPLDVTRVCTQLPRLPSESNVVIVKGKSSHVSEAYRIGKEKVYRALQFLMANNVLYQNVTLNENLEFNDLCDVFVETCSAGGSCQDELSPAPSVHEQVNAEPSGSTTLNILSETLDTAACINRANVIPKELSSTDNNLSPSNEDLCKPFCAFPCGDIQCNEDDFGTADIISSALHCLNSEPALNHMYSEDNQVEPPLSCGEYTYFTYDQVSVICESSMYNTNNFCEDTEAKELNFNSKEQYSVNQNEPHVCSMDLNSDVITANFNLEFDLECSSESVSHVDDDFDSGSINDDTNNGDVVKDVITGNFNLEFDLECSSESVSHVDDYNDSGSINDDIPLDESTVRHVDYILPSTNDTYEFNICQSKPLSTFTTEHLESKTFPMLFPYGNNDFDEKRSTFINRLLLYFQSRLLNYDCRWSTCPSYMFWALNKYEQEKVQKSINIALKMRQSPNVLCAGNIQSGSMPAVIEKSYQYMSGIRGSHSYWRKFKLHTLAIMKDRGPPTWFITFSAADMHWDDLASVLLECTALPDIKGKKLDDLTSANKRAMLIEQPVTAARHFDRRFRLFVKHIVTPKQPFGKVLDVVWRCEFQLRGSVHIHSLWWCENAPNLDTSEGLREAPSYIDRFVTCRLPDPEKEPTLYALVNSRQRHNHTHTCYKSGSKSCRFDYPLPVCEATCIKTHDDPGNASRMYLLKRSKESQYINAYNETCLKYWGANMDIQLVGGSVMGTVYYVCHYMCKEESSMLRHAVQDGLATLPNNANNRQKMNKVANVLLSHREVSSQEVAYRLCGLPLRGSSVATVFVSTSYPEDRIRLLKSPEMLKDLDEDDTDVFKTSIHDRYANRPKSEEFEILSLAQFATLYKVVYSKKTDDDSDNSDDDILDASPDTKMLKFKLLNKTGTIAKRKKPACLRIPLKTPERDGDAYAYSILLLYCPWRVETELTDGFPTASDALKAKMNMLKTLNTHDNFVENVMNAMRVIDNCMLDSDVVGMTLAPATHQTGECSKKYDSILHPGDLDGEVAFDNNVNELATANEALVIPVMSNDKFKSLVASLNTEQTAVFKYIYSHYKEALDNIISDKPLPKSLCIFCTGGAGSGKSYLISAIYQFLQKISLYPDEPTVLITAYTGVAAFNIGGITLHRAFGLQVEHGHSESYRKLSDQRLHDLRLKWNKVHTIIIDEISFVSYSIFNQIHLRCCEIFDNDLLFGGRNVLAFGDLYQLPPVAGTMVFKQPKKKIGQANIWQDNFKVVVLEQNMRQHEDASFANLLNRIRIGCHTEYDINMLQTRLSKCCGGDVDENQPPFDKAIRIFPKRAACKNYNDRQADDLPMTYTLYATDVRISSRAHNPGTEFQMLEKHLIPDDDDDCAGLATQLCVGVGARVMLRRNIFTEDGLVNGAMGIVSGFNFNEDDPVPKAILVKFDDPRVGKITMCNIHLEQPSVPIKRVSAHYMANEGVMAERTQFPLTLCWASTVHKMQGCTLPAAVVDVGQGIFMPGYGLAYVALSRVRNLSSLCLTDLSKDKFKTSASVGEEMTRLTQTMKLL